MTDKLLSSFFLFLSFILSFFLISSLPSYSPLLLSPLSSSILSLLLLLLRDNLDRNNFPLPQTTSLRVKEEEEEEEEEEEFSGNEVTR